MERYERIVLLVLAVGIWAVIIGAIVGSIEGSALLESVPRQ